MFNICEDLFYKNEVFFQFYNKAKEMEIENVIDFIYAHRHQVLDDSILDIIFTGNPNSEEKELLLDTYAELNVKNYQIYQ